MIDCSPVFPKWDSATAKVTDDQAEITLQMRAKPHLEIQTVTIAIDKLANFLEELRREQERTSE